MLRKEMTKMEIERELQGKGDYVLIDNITRFLKENPPVDIKRFLYTKLIAIYERRNMFADAADICNKLIEIIITPADKLNYLVKATGCYIKAGFFDKADMEMKKALSEAKPMERSKINLSVMEFYKNQAQTYEKERRRNRAVQVYEKILTMGISEAEKGEINKKLLGLYKELGMMEPYMVMRKKLGM